MTAQAIALILVSALLHAGWNLIGKRTAQTVRFYAFAMGCGMLIFSPLLIRAWDDVIIMPGSFWLLLILSGLCQTLYMTGLSLAYRAGDLSMVYPLARAIPVLLVPLLVLLVYGKTALELQDVVGMLLIIFGSMALPLTHWRNLHFRHYCTPAIGWVLMAASATTGYSLVDSIAIGMMVETGIDSFTAGSSFVVLQAAATLLWMLPFVRLVMKESLWKVPNIGMTALAGSFIIGTYLLILISMSMVEEVSYVVALRQVSIPLGVAIGFIWLREPVSMPRLQGLLLMLTGLVMVSL